MGCRASRHLLVELPVVNLPSAHCITAGDAPPAACHIYFPGCCRIRAGTYNENVFRGVDYVIAQAARYGIKVIIALGTYWDTHDGAGGVSSAVQAQDPFEVSEHGIPANIRAHALQLCWRCCVHTGR